MWVPPALKRTDGFALSHSAAFHIHNAVARCRKLYTPRCPYARGPRTPSTVVFQKSRIYAPIGGGPPRARAECRKTTPAQFSPRSRSPARTGDGISAGPALTRRPAIARVFREDVFGGGILYNSGRRNFPIGHTLKGVGARARMRSGTSQLAGYRRVGGLCPVNSALLFSLDTQRYRGFRICGRAHRSRPKPAHMVVWLFPRKRFSALRRYFPPPPSRHRHQPRNIARCLARRTGGNRRT